jgi:hypothetical protein
LLGSLPENQLVAPRGLEKLQDEITDSIDRLKLEQPWFKCPSLPRNVNGLNLLSVKCLRISGLSVFIRKIVIHVKTMYYL